MQLQSGLAQVARKPLYGRRIVVPRSREGTSRLAEMLEEQGAEVLEAPSIRTLPPEDWAPLDACIARLEEYQFLCFTSATSVACFWERLGVAGRNTRDLAHLRIAAFGLATAEALRARGLRPDLDAPGYRPEEVGRALEGMDLTRAAVLFPGAVGAREGVPDVIRQRGAHVDVAPGFRTALVEREGEQLLALFRDQRIDAVAFTSSSTVTSFLEAIGPNRPATLLHNVAVACIGPMVSETARGAGLPVHIQPEESSLPALQEALVTYFASGDSPCPR